MEDQYDMENDFLKTRLNQAKMNLTYGFEYKTKKLQTKERRPRPLTIHHPLEKLHSSLHYGEVFVQSGLGNLAVFGDVAESITKSGSEDVPPRVNFILLNGVKLRLPVSINLKHEKIPKMDWRLQADEFYFKAGIRKNTVKVPVLLSTKRHHFRYCFYNDELKIILNFDGLSLPSRISDGENVRAVVVFKVVTLKAFFKEFFTPSLEEPLIWRLWSFISPDIRFTVKRDHRDESKTERDLVLKDIFDMILMKAVDPMVSFSSLFRNSRL